MRKRGFCLILAWILCMGYVLAAETSPLDQGIPTTPDPVLTAPIRQVSVGTSSAAIGSDGSLWTWESASYGMLGDGSTKRRSTPEKIMDGVAAVCMSPSSHCAAVKTDGSLWTWGRNNCGQLGDGSTEDRSTPVRVMEGVVAVSVAGLHSAAIKADGSLWTWGYNDHGELGDGGSGSRSTPAKIMDGVAAVSLGSRRSAAIKTDGSLWTWGTGLLGDGGSASRSLPARVMENVAAVSLGYDSAAVIKTDGSLWTWGSNENGQLGDGSAENRDLPAKIMDSVASVCMGTVSCAAVQTDGSLWTWGDNSKGQLGDGGTEVHFTPVKVMEGVASVSVNGTRSAAVKSDGSLWIWGSTVDEQSMYGFDKTIRFTCLAAAPFTGPVRQVSVGPAVAAVKSDGSLWTWGSNQNGQLTGWAEDRRQPVKVMEDVASVSVGGYHSAVVKTDGSLWFWGVAWGDMFLDNIPDPQRMMEDVAAVSLGFMHSAALKKDGTLWTWGNNGAGQLGDGVPSSRGRKEPGRIMEDVAAVSLGEQHSAAIKTDGTLWTWGKNNCGQLGDGSTENRSVPVKIMDGVAAVNLCGDHSAAIKTDGSLWAWGDNYRGQLGDGSTENRSVPVKIMDGVAAVSLDYDSSAAIKTDGSLWTWGNNGAGQLGDGSTENRLTPVKIMEGVASVSRTSAAVKTDGSLWVWGGLSPARSGARGTPVCIGPVGSGAENQAPPSPSPRPELPRPADTGFDDVAPGAWYAPYVAYVASSGVMIGTGERRFEPERELNRMECLTLAMRLYELQRGGPGVIRHAPENWGKISLVLSDGTQYSGYGYTTIPGRTVLRSLPDGTTVEEVQPNGLWYRYGLSAGGWSTELVYQCIRMEITPEEKERVDALADKSAAATVDGVSFHGTVNCDWLDIFVLDFLPDEAEQDAALAALYPAVRYSADPQNWFRDTLYTFQDLVPEEERGQFAGISAWDNGNYLASRWDFADAIQGSAGPLEQINSITLLPDTTDRDILYLYNAGILNGMDKRGTFDPYRTLTRAEAATMVARVLNPELRLRFVLD